MNQSGALLLSVLMLGTMLLGAGGLYLVVSARDRRKGLLMLIAAAILFGNVLIWTL